jgi:Flp pilus assembly pilin Flp
VEYMTLVILIAVAYIGTTTLFGNTVQNKISTAEKAIDQKMKIGD